MSTTDVAQWTCTVSNLGFIYIYAIYSTSQDRISSLFLGTKNHHFHTKKRLLKYELLVKTEACFARSNCPGGFSHWQSIRICACLLGCCFTKFGTAIGGFHRRRRSPNYINWVYFGQIIVKSIQFGQNWVLFFGKWYSPTDGWEIRQKIDIQKFRFSKSCGHIQVWFWWKWLKF